MIKNIFIPPYTINSNIFYLSKLFLITRGKTKTRRIDKKATVENDMN
jgi:hypothetical protein